jgi:hypothetical protein
MTAAARVQLIKDFLTSPTKKPKAGPSWLASFVRFHNVRGNLALEGTTLTKWYDLVHSFALMPPLTDQDAVARYLGRLEKGIPIRDKGSTRLGNGPPDTRLLKLRRLRSTRVPMSTPRSL